MEFVQVDLNNLDLLEAFYKDIYVLGFPDVDEHETLENLITYLKLSQENKGIDYKYYILLLKEGSNIIGGCIFDHYLKNKSAYIEFIVVKDSEQSKGYGRILYNKVLEYLPDVKDIIIEVNNPEYLQPGESLKYLNFWHSLGYRQVDVNYIQPPLSQDKEEVKVLWLALSTDNNYIKKDRLLDILECCFKYTMQIEKPKETKQYKVLNKTIQYKKIALLKLIH